MKKKLLIAGLLVALVAPAAQAAGLSLDGTSAPERIILPSLIPPIKTEGGFLGQQRLALLSNPRSLWINGGYKVGNRVHSRSSTTTYFDPEGGSGPINGYNPPSVPEPEGLAVVLAAGILGLGYAGYTFGQRRRVLAAAQVQ